MKAIDFDATFDEKLALYMSQNKDKHTEREWENVIPKLYKKFGDTKIGKLGCTPKEYYARMSDTELAETLGEHLDKDIPVPEFLCTELESRSATEALLPFLKEENSSAVSYAVNIIGEDKRAFDEYFRILIENRSTEDIRSDITDILRAHADEVKERAVALYKEGKAKEYVLEILSRCKRREDEIFEILLTAFRLGEETATHAGYLAAYGDERALPYLLSRIEDRSIGFVEFQELKYAIEALGGTYDEERDFSKDKDYLAVELATQKAQSPENLS